MSVEARNIIQLVEAQLGISSVKESDRIVEDLGAESMDIVSIVVMLEEQYAVFIDDAELPNISTVKDLITMATWLSR